jgi:hypothetical protein
MEPLERRIMFKYVNRKTDWIDLFTGVFIVIALIFMFMFVVSLGLDISQPY